MANQGMEHGGRGGAGGFVQDLKQAQPARRDAGRGLDDEDGIDLDDPERAAEAARDEGPESQGRDAASIDDEQLGGGNFADDPERDGDEEIYGEGAPKSGVISGGTSSGRQSATGSFANDPAPSAQTGRDEDDRH